MRRLIYNVLRLSSLITAILFLWILLQSPFTKPLINATVNEARHAIAKAMTRQVTSEWLLPKYTTAIETADLDGIALMEDLVLEYSISLPPDLKQRADQAVSDASGLIAFLGSCANCAWDISSCQTLGQIASCALPVEMTPLGDMNALRRAGVDWAIGNDIDKLDAGLALVGLSATTIVILTGGTSYTLKIGETVLRAGKRMGAINSKFLRVLAQTANIPVNWARIPSYIIGRTPLDEVVNPKHITQLSSLAANIGTVRRNTSLAETIVLLKYVDGADDARKLAHLSDVNGAKTFRTLHVLGKQKSFRLLLKMSRMTKIAIGLAFALIAQLLGLFSSQILRMLKRAVQPNPRS